MMKGNILIRFAAFFVIYITVMMTATGQRKVAGSYPQGYFRNPLGIPFSLSANFGELRTNHWHMGLDLRTDQKENLPVYASGDGFVKTIGIRPLSFGRFMIIEHPNGYSTLYAHLNSFFPELEEYVINQQREKESWALELDLQKNQFPLQKGELIAYSGNTGGSQGPHLHFEIRETESGRSLNPLLFGFDINDDIAPVINKVALYDRRQSTYQQTPTVFNVKRSGNNYSINQPKLLLGTKKFSLAISAYDLINGSSSNEGIFGARVFLDDEPLFVFELDNINYTESVYINARIDYKFNDAKGISLQHLSRLPGDNAPLYREMENDGVIELTDTSEHNIRIQVLDAYDNSSELYLIVQYSDSLAKKENQLYSSSNKFIPGYVSIIEEKDFQLNLQESCVYDTVNAVYSRIQNFSPGAVSAQHRINDPSIPVHCDFIVRLSPNTELTEQQKQKTVVVREWKGKRSIKKAIWEQDWASATFSDFGYFQLFTDMESPKINPPAKLKDTLDLSPLNRIIFTPTDNSGIRSFRAELDGEWLKFSNDKGRNFIYYFDEQCPYGVHELKVCVEDLVGNSTERTWWFKKYPYTPPKKKAIKKKSSGKKKPKKKK